MKQLAESIRDIPDFPKEGIIFKDITTLLADAEAFHKSIDTFIERYRAIDIDVVLGVEARGFIFGAALAYGLENARSTFSIRDRFHPTPQHGIDQLDR